MPIDLATNELRCFIGFPSETCSNTFFNQGIRQYNNYAFNRAIESFEKAIDVDTGWRSQGQRTLTFLNLGLTYSQIGNLEEAIRMYEYVIEIDPENADARCNLGYIYLDQGDYLYAEVLFQNAENIYIEQGVEDFCKHQ